jgi:hypothetical protein
VVELRREREWREGIGPRLAYASDGSAWAAATPRGLTIFEDDAPAVAAPYVGGLLGELAFAPGDRRVLAAPGAFDRDEGAWAPLPDPYPAITGDLDPEAAMGFEIHGGAWDAEGGSLALYAEYRAPRGIDAPSGYGGPGARLALLDAAAGTLETLLWEGDYSSPHRAIAVGDGFVAAGGVAVGVWERDGGRPLAVLDGLGTLARVVRISPDGRHLAAGAAGGRAAVWDTETWVRRMLWEAHADETVALAFHGDVLATGGADGHVALWSLEGEPLGGATLDGPVVGLAYRPDGGRLLAATGGPSAAVVALTAAA